MSEHHSPRDSSMVDDALMRYQLARVVRETPPPWLFPFLLSITTAVAGAFCLGGHVEQSAITSPWGWVGVGLLIESVCIDAAMLLGALVSWRTRSELRAHAGRLVDHGPSGRS